MIFYKTQPSSLCVFVWLYLKRCFWCSWIVQRFEPQNHWADENYQRNKISNSLRLIREHMVLLASLRIFDIHVSWRSSYDCGYPSQSFQWWSVVMTALVAMIILTALSVSSLHTWIQFSSVSCLSLCWKPPSSPEYPSFEWRLSHFVECVSFCFKLLIPSLNSCLWLNVGPPHHWHCIHFYLKQLSVWHL